MSQHTIEEFCQATWIVKEEINTVLDSLLEGVKDANLLGVDERIFLGQLEIALRSFLNIAIPLNACIKRLKIEHYIATNNDHPWGGPGCH
jgi:hypothetical protein